MLSQISDELYTLFKTRQEYYRIVLGREQAATLI
ncbi:hypothetical protein ES708_09001 [subsurface metagenome]